MFVKLQEIAELKPYKLLSLSVTRWLALEAVSGRISLRYDVLLDFYKQVSDNERDPKAIEVYNMLQNKITEVY